MLKKLAFLFCLQISLAFSMEQYQLNIEKAFEVCHFENSDVRDLFLRIHENEKKHPDYIQCVTAQDSLFYAYQVIAKELYRKIYGNPREDFEFLRFPTQNLLKSRDEFFFKYPALHPSEEIVAKSFKTTPERLEETIRAHEKQDEEDYLGISRGEEEADREWNEEEEDTSPFQINDTVPEISKELLSVNFTMETYRPLDSALFVFLSGKSVSLNSEKFVQILSELFEPFDLPQEKLTICLEKLIEQMPPSKFGIINQIFIPKEHVRDCLYLSFGGGFLHSMYDSKFEESYSEFQQSRQDESFRTFRNFQARIIVGALFANPEVKILRHSLIPNEEQEQYEAVVRDTISELFDRNE